MRLGTILSLTSGAVTIGVVGWVAVRRWMAGEAPNTPPTVLISLLPAGASAAAPGVRAGLRHLIRIPSSGGVTLGDGARIAVGGHGIERRLADWLPAPRKPWPAHLAAL